MKTAAENSEEEDSTVKRSLFFRIYQTIAGDQWSPLQLYYRTTVGATIGRPLLFFAVLFILSCNSEPQQNNINDRATHFSIDTIASGVGETARVLTIKEAWNGNGENYEWQISNTPVKKAVVLSTVAIAFMERLDLLDRVVAIENRNLIYSEKMQRLIDSLGGEQEGINKGGIIKEVGSGNTLDLETILMLKPDIVLTFGTGSSLYDDYPKLQAAGVPVLLTAEWMESSPMARFEWIKVFGLLFGKEREADSIFNEMSKKYNSLLALAKTADKKPLVLTGYPQGAEWLAGGGKSYFAKFLRDAGATYLWENTPQTGLLNLNIETALQTGMKADFWLHPSLWTSRTEIMNSEPRMEMLPLWSDSLSGGHIWQSSKRTGKNGSRDFYESAIVYPDVVLADLIGIFHPEILPNREFVYYEPVK